MDALFAVVALKNKFAGFDWSLWAIIGWIGNATFFSRFFVQWYVTEKKRQVVVPAAFWWLSLIGSLLLLIYGLSRHDGVFIFAYAFTWIPYIRNLVIHHRHLSTQQLCPDCGLHCPPGANFCSACGTRLAPEEARAT